MTKQNTNNRRRPQASRQVVQRNGRFNFNGFPIVRFPSPMPRRAFTTLRWSLAGQVTVNATPWVNDNQIKLNSIFSPNGTHQPLGHDEWATFYNRYVVIGADVKVTIANTTSQSTVNSLHAAIVGTNSLTTITAPSTAMEQYSGTFLLEIGSPGAPPIVFNRRYNLRDIYGCSDQTLLADDRFQATFGADPSEVCNLHIVTSRDGATAYTYDYTINILYHVVMFDSGQLPQS